MMLTEDGCRQRRTNFWRCVPENIDWVLIADARHVQYFCGFRIHPLSFSADQRALLLLKRDGRATLICDNFVRRTASCPFYVDEEVTVSWYTHRKSVINRDDALHQALQDCRSQWSTSLGAIEPEAVPEVIAAAVSEYSDWQFQHAITGKPTTAGHIIRELRRQKLPDEVELLKACMAAGEAGHAAAFDAVRSGATELDVYLAIQQAAIRQAGQACVVYGDFRANSAAQPKAGGLPTCHSLQHGELFIADFSVILHGYRSDFTNTIAVGTPSDAQVAMFEACRDALLAAEAELKAGQSARRIYEAASTVFTDRNYPPLSHHCGHGLGMEHPEPPILVPESTDTLLVGDVVTIEPGLYVEGTGGMRFEHNYLVTNTGCERLSNHRIALIAD
ncbi:MAG: Xaa-Pro peptidase family protein [Planctomycetaceae bacterium]